MKDALGDRMKKNYENRTRFLLPRRTYTVIRIDGKAFHTYTRGLTRPFDMDLIEDMDATAVYLCKNIQGAKFGFVQSDEISILMTDFEEIGTDAWFDGNIQKIVSVAASMATGIFNRLRDKRYDQNKKNIEILGMTDKRYEKEPRIAEFDARTFTIPSKDETMNYFIWRQQDTVRNSISSVAQSFYKNHNDLKGMNTSKQQEMIFQKGVNWNDYAAKLKRGRFITKEQVDMTTPFTSVNNCQFAYKRNVWKSIDCPTFTQDREFLSERIPNL